MSLINVEERPGSYPRARSNRAHYESRVAFMSALIQQDELDQDSTSTSTSNKSHTGKDNTNSNSSAPLSPSNLTLELSPNTTVIASPMTAGDPKDDPMLWDPAEHQARRAQFLERYYASLEEQSSPPDEQQQEQHDPSTPDGSKKRKKRALVGIQPVRGDHLDRQWVAAMSVGTPSQLFSVVFDTGSSDVWVASTACATQPCSMLRRFNPMNSRTFESLDHPWSINYADNTWIRGNLGRDDVSVAGITIRKQTLGLATTITTRTEVDGIMGLGFDSNSEIPGMKTPVTNMIEQGQIDQPIVSVWLNKASNQGKDVSDGGQFIFGGMDSSLFNPPITYLPVTSSREWQVATDKVYLGSKLLTSNPPDAIIDTGASYIVFPESLATSFHRLIPNSQYDQQFGWLVPCSMASSRTIGDLTFVFDGTRFSVPFSDIVILKSEYNGFCFSAIDSWREVDGHGGQNTIVLGDLFIKNQYVIYDYGKKQIGLAQKVENTPTGIGLNSRNAAGMDRRSLLTDTAGKCWRYAATTAAAGVLAAAGAGLVNGVL
ncbi:hypothetical protein BGW41_003132 [Actinomortierella wolfii]|nr:hypothetical protein BGW41_003132 [Actinomortierella wolfii]